MAARKGKRKTKRATVKRQRAMHRRNHQGRNATPATSSKRRRPKSTNGSPQANPPTPGGNSVGPNGIRVRMYRVGFGDFFMLSLQTPAGQKHILIDCGVHACDIHSINAAIAQMAEDTGRELALVIMTHRHADHISGFTKCKDVFSQFTVEQVWMSWFEDPSDKAAVNFQKNLALMAEQMKLALAARNRPEDDELDFMVENIIGEALGAAGGGSNDVALQVLHGGFKNKAPVAYYKAGDTPKLPQDLVDAGLTAQILGPPHDLALVAQMNGKNEQYLAANDPSVATPVAPFDEVFRITAQRYPTAAFREYNRHEIEQSVMDLQPDMLAAKARQADKTLNNQSLVVLFTFNGKHLLFAGDAQWGNWENFLYGGKAGASGHTALTQQSRSILASLDFYKVGHHGSTNATPKDALNAMREGCVAMCSTEPGCYGKPSSGTEVPRIPLLEAIEKRTDNQLACSDQVEAGDKPANIDRPALAKAFSTSGELYIDYRL
jgi:beta-lactamase superfamily II metal-dependent hydrolase